MDELVEYKQFDRSQPLDLEKMSLDSKKLYPHQTRAIEALDKYFDLPKNHGMKNGLLAMPTGSGKTFTAVNWLLDRAVANGYKVLWLVHRQELVDQADFTFRFQSPLLLKHGWKKFSILPVSGAHYHISMASGYHAYVCSIASVANKYGMRYIGRLLGQAGKEKLVVVIDEAHHAVSPSYQKVLKKITEINPNRLLLGLTATPTRMQEDEKRRLLKMFEAIPKNRFICQVSLKELLTHGFLAKPVYKRIETHIEGDVEFNISPQDEQYFAKFGELTERIKEQVARSARRNEMIVKEYIDNKAKYGKTLVFAVNRLHAVLLKKTFDDAFSKIGETIKCEYCISGDPDVQDKIRRFKAKEKGIDILINVQILTEGSDVPDIQSVFLTRETNSDSLLMQMIGRGLRGEDAGGTKFAYIVDFHDTWNRFQFWLDPGKKLLEEFDGEIEIVPPSEPPTPPASPEPPILPEPPIPPDIGSLYMKIYAAMKSNITGLSHNESFPHGWYSVVDEEGDYTNVLVYDSQLEGYQLLDNNMNLLLERKPDPLRLIKDYFDSCLNIPNEDEMALILDYIYETQQMPAYYTFEDRDRLDPSVIASELIKKDLRRSEEEVYLKNKFDSESIIRNLYKTLFDFEESISQAILRIKNPSTITEIITIDERKEFNIVDNYYNLNLLLNEVVTESKARELFDARNLIEKLPEIRWSNKPLRSRYGLCRLYNDGSTVISVNKLLCSPDVPEEVVKYIIYHELIHSIGHWYHDDIFRTIEWAYPNSAELDGFLDELFLRYKIDEIVPPRPRRSSIPIETLPKAEEIENSTEKDDTVPYIDLENETIKENLESPPGFVNGKMPHLNNSEESATYFEYVSKKENRTIAEDIFYNAYRTRILKSK